MESDVQKKIKNKLEAKGWKVLKIIQLSENGYPDLLCLKNSRAVFIEVKDKCKKLRTLQELRIETLIKLGFTAFCCDSENDTKILNL